MFCDVYTFKGLSDEEALSLARPMLESIVNENQLWLEECVEGGYWLGIQSAYP